MIAKLSKALNNVTLIDDRYQHSVSGQNNGGEPFAKSKMKIGYKELLRKLREEGFGPDEETLRKSRRCAPAICSFVSEKLGIRIDSSGHSEGKVIWV